MVKWILTATLALVVTLTACGQGASESQSIASTKSASRAATDLPLSLRKQLGVRADHVADATCRAHQARARDSGANSLAAPPRRECRLQFLGHAHGIRYLQFEAGDRW